jgi:predicted DNA-binding protein YlxM (UPF0122 family)
MRHKKTDWGVKLYAFCHKYGLTKKEVAEAAGVKVSVIYAASVNRTAGHEVIKKVDDFIEQYERKQHEALLAEYEAALKARP